MNREQHQLSILRGGLNQGIALGLKTCSDSLIDEVSRGFHDAILNDSLLYILHILVVLISIDGEFFPLAIGMILYDTEKY